MSDRKISQVAKELIAAKKRIENPENWCQSADREGDRICAVNALFQGRGIPEHFTETPACKALIAAAFSLFDNSPIAVNYEGHAAVMRMYDHAIATEIQKANAS